MKRSISQIGMTLVFMLVGIAMAGPSDSATLAEIDTVRAMLENWRKAWESKDIERFMAFYSPRFESKGLDYDAWKNRKQQLFNVRGKIAVELIDPWVLIEGDRASVRFIQRYQGPTGNDAGEKTMDLQRSAETWQILSEIWQPLPQPLAMPARDAPEAPLPVAVAPEPAKQADGPKNSTGQEKARYLVGTGNGANQVYYYADHGSEGVSIEFSSCAIPNFFTLEGDRPRIVIDVREVSDWQGPAKIPINADHIRQIRTFLHHPEQRLRIVLDMYPNRDYMIDQIYDIDRNIYRIAVEGVN